MEEKWFLVGTAPELLSPHDLNCKKINPLVSRNKK
jgi:hypothetical protein